MTLDNIKVPKAPDWVLWVALWAWEPKVFRNMRPLKQPREVRAVRRATRMPMGTGVGGWGGRRRQIRQRNGQITGIK
jgi:hypothetical protein